MDKNNITMGTAVQGYGLALVSIALQIKEISLLIIGTLLILNGFYFWFDEFFKRKLKNGKTKIEKLNLIKKTSSVFSILGLIVGLILNGLIHPLTIPFSFCLFFFGFNYGKLGTELKITNKARKKR